MAEQEGGRLGGAELLALDEVLFISLSVNTQYVLNLFMMQTFIYLLRI